ncbi:hypothetical protein Acsp03_50730 [Actinomadura sp. NBRC 104412]|uniref:hypothetical protein n=1 Tax=Actinomadura sp. NBRC 104412 TaxID=3032203 RepID=UPI0024A29C23|nr:hypothetical protein [Actinomadura sp. NBRC 104412]GLZ07607.1 hypothetical protein Acsp03_50730 [Actinomadura sp. NBRC 104412]
MVTDRRTGYLEELEHELDTWGLVARVVRTRSGPAFLRVVNPEAASLAEDVTCAPAPETHVHYYWWSWGERLHRVDDPGGAAVKLARVLQPLEAHGDLLGTRPLEAGMGGPDGPRPGPEGPRARSPERSASGPHPP